MAVGAQGGALEQPDSQVREADIGATDPYFSDRLRFWRPAETYSTLSGGFEGRISRYRNHFRVPCQLFWTKCLK